MFNFRELTLSVFGIHNLKDAQDMLFVYYDGMAIKGPKYVFFSNAMTGVENHHVFCDVVGSQKQSTLFYMSFQPSLIWDNLIRLTIIVWLNLKSQIKNKIKIRLILSRKPHYVLYFKRKKKNWMFLYFYVNALIHKTDQIMNLMMWFSLILRLK